MTQVSKDAKRPVEGSVVPGYPPEGSCRRVDRRRFIAVAGIGCVGLLGASVAPAGCDSSRIFRRRLPATDSRTTSTADWGTAGYVVHTEHLFARFSQFLEFFEEDLLVLMDGVFAGQMTVDDLSEPEGIAGAEELLWQTLLDAYREEDDADPGIVDIRLEITRLQKQDGPDGMAASRSMRRMRARGPRAIRRRPGKASA